MQPPVRTHLLTHANHAFRPDAHHFSLQLSLQLQDIVGTGRNKRKDLSRSHRLRHRRFQLYNNLLRKLPELNFGAQRSWWTHRHVVVINLRGCERRGSANLRECQLDCHWGQEDLPISRYKVTSSTRNHGFRGLILHYLCICNRDFKKKQKCGTVLSQKIRRYPVALSPQAISQHELAPKWA